MSKFFRKKTCTLIILLIFISVCAYTHALAAYGFEENDLSQEDADRIWTNVNIQNSTEGAELYEVSDAIVNFDVSENRNILLGLYGNKIVVIDENSKLLYFFTFSCSGTFYVKWHKDNILLMLTRGAIIMEFSLDGQLINMVKVDEKSIGNDELWDQLISKREVCIDSDVFLVRNQMGGLEFFAPEYSQLVKADVDGNETIIYDVSNMYTARIITILILSIAFLLIVVLTIIIRARRSTSK